MQFTVYNADGTEINYNKICKEKWAENLIWCDIDGWAITEDGDLVLMDDCGNCAYAPSDRFKIVVWDNHKCGECKHYDECKPRDNQGVCYRFMGIEETQMSIDEAIAFAERNEYNKEVIERLKDYRALLMFLARVRCENSKQDLSDIDWNK